MKPRRKRSARPAAGAPSARAKRRSAGRAAGGAAAFPIVGIGASASGLDACKKFFAAMPADCGAAYVLVPHLDPARESLTAELVGTYTRMRVVQVHDGMPVEPNRVYVIPPNANPSLRDRTLRLSPSLLPRRRPDGSPRTAPRRLRRAVDFFLRSLAKDQRENAIGVVLAGTGSDGTLGLKEIKAAGGLTMVQDPGTAPHDGMPHSAIAGGSADHVLEVEQLADALLAQLRCAGAATGMPARRERATDPLAAALEVLRARTRFDFSRYKKGTLRRRLEHRMALRHLRQLSGYVEVLRHDPAEAAALSRDLLIHVTRFFREPAAWRFLRARVIRPLVAEKGAAPLRVWIPACATGEEAYSIAMVLLEEIEAAGKVRRLQVFASDVDVEALETARAGIYPRGIAAHVSARRLSRFFVEGEHGYQVSKELREAVVFAQQSPVSDPPFSRLDLISCRNLYLYLEPALQDRLVPLLHFALVDGGYLFLGSAEGLGLQQGLFEPVSRKWRIYRRVGPTRHEHLQFPLATAPLSIAARGRGAGLPNQPRLAVLAQHLLLQRYAPACVIVNRAGEILYYHGRTADYLAQPSGLPTGDLVAQARRGLRAALHGALRAATRDHQRVVVAGLPMRRADGVRRVKLTVEPLDGSHGELEDLWLASLEDEGESTAAAARPGAEVGAADTAGVRQLEHELESTQADLQQTIEDLRAANEELMSVNEELQSSNEELETSKEELQSLNEELTTANSQLATKIGELEATNTDLDNLLTSTNVATLFLDAQLRIRRFTPTATELFSLIPSDIGRPIGDIAQKFVDPELLRDAAAVLRHPVAPRTEVQAHDGRWYVRQVLAYRGREQRTEGVVMTFSDVAAEALQEARLYAESIVDTVGEPLLVLDSDLRVRSANQSFYDAFRFSPAQTTGRLLCDLGERQWDMPKLRTLLGKVLTRKHVLSDFPLEADFASLGRRMLRLNARVIDRGDDRAPLILLAMEDITERERAREALRETEARTHAENQVRQRQAELAHALRISTVGELASGLAHELNQPLSAIVNGVEACAGYVRSGKTAPRDLVALLDDVSSEALRAAAIVEHLRHFIEKGKPSLGRADLCEIARNVSRLLGREIHEAGIALRLDLPSRPVPIRADRIQIEQIMVNLMQNAVDAIREAPRKAPRKAHEIELQVWTAQGKAEVAVRDTGLGASTKATERMFEPFFTTKARGLGMGLAISRSILEAHRGRIWVKRRADGARGTTIRFTLPLAPAVRRRPKPR